IISSSRGPVATDRLMQLGPVISAASLAGLSIILRMQIPGHEDAIAWGIGALLFGVGFGIGITWPHLLTKLFRRSPAGQENIASSAIITVQLYALAFGAALGGMVTNAAGFTDPG